MSELAALLLRLFQNLWHLLALSVAVVTTLVLLASALRATASTAIGGSLALAEALGAGLSAFLLAVTGFYLIPALTRGVLQAYAALFPACSQSPFFREATTLVLQLFVAIGALRMLKAVLVAVIMTAVGGSGTVASAILEVAEVVASALFLALIVPLVQASLGAC